MIYRCPYRTMSVTILGQWQSASANMYCLTKGIYIGFTDTYRLLHILFDVDSGAEYYTDKDAYQSTCEAYRCKAYRCIYSRKLNHNGRFYALQATRSGDYVCVAVAHNVYADNLDWLSKIDDRRYMFEISCNYVITRGVVRFDN